ncbi:PCYCGC domain-containing protein [Risungbinella massiliensis]|nr:PCYCGC domain-containing protein [Risungbinella massiliensis]
MDLLKHHKGGTQNVKEIRQMIDTKYQKGYAKPIHTPLPV